MLKFLSFLLIFFILNSFCFSESYIVKLKNAHSYQEFVKYYKRESNLKNFAVNGVKIIPNRIHRFHFIKSNNSTIKSYSNNFSNTTDPMLGEQTWLQVVNGLKLIDISKGSGIIVGLLDSGVELDHEDLNGQFLKYYNVAEDSYDVSDGFGHGTSVAGIIGAIANNGVGIRGVAPDVKFVVAKINKGASPTFDDYSVAKGIYYLVDNGAKVINMSIEMSQSNQAIEDAISYAKEKGVILVAATGNGGNDEESYPASNSYVLGVGSVNNDFEKSSFSDYDNQTFIFAPGEQVLTTYIGDSYLKQTGTSFSAPIVTGIIADLLSLNPYFSLDNIKEIILSHAYYDVTEKYKVVDLSDSAYGTGVYIQLNKTQFLYGDYLYLSLILPPLSSNFDFYFGFIMPDNNVAVLHYNNGLYYTSLNSDYSPTWTFSKIEHYSSLTLYGDANSVSTPLKLEGNIIYGTYKACALYRKDNRIVGYVNCQEFNISK